jgi:hypothetical protein
MVPAEPYDPGMDNEIRVPAKVCGKRRCTKTTAKVDTGAFGTILSEDVAASAGVEYTGATVKAKGVSKRGVTLREGEATICLPGKCGCRKQKVYVADNGVLNDPVLLGMDYLDEAKAMIDTQRRTVSCRCRGKRR